MKYSLGRDGKKKSNYRIYMNPLEIFNENSNFFYIALKHNECDKLLEYIKEYCQDYIVSLESDTVAHKDTDGEHFHILCNWKEDKKYEKFRDNVILKIFDRRGQAKNGLSRQYGKDTKQIRDLERCLAYMLKEKTGKFYSSFEISDEKLKEFFDMSFKKKKTKEIFDLILEYLEDIIQTYEDYDGYTRDCGNIKYRGKTVWDYLDNIRMNIIEYFVINNITIPTRNTIENYLRNFIRMTSKYNHDEKLDYLFKVIYGK